MTMADYVAIAISPPLIMALVGSLVFFLLEVFYVGQYQARLNYVFALFVLAAVLIGRIAIQFGSQRAVLFALPLGTATFLVLWRFVEHPSPLSPLINIFLIAVVWWCAHQLTWDCTLIDDDQDASGEGLMQRLGVDETAPAPDADSGRGTADSELLDDHSQGEPWWQRLVSSSSRPHTPGLWVLYFSLAALPLFGIGQRWIPAADTARRQYVFVLLLVYVAAGLALLVTTSFLGLRRYLRQRRVEMPAPMAATWIAVGATLLVLVMFVAALVPRPHAEYAISKPPWEISSPADLKPSRHGVGQDAVEPHPEAVQSGAVDKHNASETTSDTGTGDEPSQGEHGELTSSDAQGQRTQPNDQPGQAQSSSPSPDSSPNSQAQSPAEDSSSETSPTDGDRQASATNNRSQNRPDDRPADQEPPPGGQQPTGPDRSESQQDNGQGNRQWRSPLVQHDRQPLQTTPLDSVTNTLGGLAGLVKLLFYIVAGLALLYLAWRYRRELWSALQDIVQGLREFFLRLLGRDPTVATQVEAGTAAKGAQSRPRFKDYQDPFNSGRSDRMPPAELVRYTFEAFEAWAGERGHPRSLDQTPQELVRASVEPRTPLHDEARRLVRLYGELAYASGTVSRDAANQLRALWRLLRDGDHVPRA